MMRCTALLLALIALSGRLSSAAEGVEKDGEVLVLTEASFPSTVLSQPETIFLVEFYAPWCGHCKSLEPEYKKAAEDLSALQSVRLAKVDATVETQLASEYSIQGYPTMKIFRDGQVYDYEGGRTVDAIVSYMKRQASPDWKPPANRVVDLSSDTFDDFVNEEKLSLVYFFAPWCGHCKSLTPEYEKAARELWDHSPRIKLAKVDATAHTALASRFEVTGYPTLKVFRNGAVYDYAGRRQSSSDIVKEMSELSQPAARLVPNSFEFDKLRRDKSVVAAFVESASDPRLQQFQEAASKYRKIDTLVYVTSPELMAKHPSVRVGDVAIFRATNIHNDLEPHVVSQPITTAKDVDEFIANKRYSLVNLLSSAKNPEDPLPQRKPLVTAFFTVDFSSKTMHDATHFHYNKLLKAAKRMEDLIEKGFITFAFGDAEAFSDLNHKEHGLPVDSDEFDEEVLVYITNDGGEIFPLKGEFSEDSLLRHIKKFSNNELQPFYKSARPPKKQGHVVEVVGDTFEAIVHDADKDVLIEFYAPWCGHCKALVPEYERLAKAMRKVGGLTIAKIDATANGFPRRRYDVKGYPTIFLAPKGDKENPIPFDGDRTAKGLKAFLRKHSSAEIPRSKKSAKKAEKGKKDEL